MPRYIVKLVDGDKNYYLEWSTIVDAPVACTNGVEAFREHYRQEYGNSKMLELEERLKRVEEKGTSSMLHDDVEELINFNNAGPSGAPLSYKELIRVCEGVEFDENHPCWENRKDAMEALYDKNGGMTTEEYERILKENPYL